MTSVVRRAIVLALVAGCQDTDSVRWGVCHGWSAGDQTTDDMHGWGETPVCTVVRGTETREACEMVGATWTLVLLQGHELEVTDALLQPYAEEACTEAGYPVLCDEQVHGGLTFVANAEACPGEQSVTP